jgi:DNA-binding MarR family transcriptional regulator
VEAHTRTLFQVAATLGQQAHRALGLGTTDLSALQALDRLAGEPVRVGRLSAAPGLSSASTTELVDRLERRGFVRRERDPRDRRQVLLVLEPAARRIAEELLAPWQHRIRAAAATLTEDDRRVVAGYLAHLLDGPPTDPPAQ